MSITIDLDCLESANTNLDKDHHRSRRNLPTGPTVLASFRARPLSKLRLEQFQVASYISRGLWKKAPRARSRRFSSDPRTDSLHHSHQLAQPHLTRRAVHHQAAPGELPYQGQTTSQHHRQSCRIYGHGKRHRIVPLFIAKQYSAVCDRLELQHISPTPSLAWLLGFLAHYDPFRYVVEILHPCGLLFR